MNRKTGRVSPALRAQMLEMRKAAGLSQRRAAIKSGITAGALSRMESGENDPSLETLETYARACGGELTLLRGDGAELVKRVEALPANDRVLLLSLARDVVNIDAATRASLQAFVEFIRAAARNDEQRDRASEAG